MGKSKSESSEDLTETSSGDLEYSEEFSEEFEAIDPDELGEEGTRGLSDILSAVGIDIGGKKQVLRDTEGNPIQPVYTDEGTYETPTLVDEFGNVVHEGSRSMGTGTKVALGAGAVALLGTAAVAATAIGVHYYRKKNAKESGKGGKKEKKSKKDKKGKKGKKDKKDKKDKKKKKKKK